MCSGSGGWCDGAVCGIRATGALPVFLHRQHRVLSGCRATGQPGSDVLLIEGFGAADGFTEMMPEAGDEI